MSFPATRAAVCRHVLILAALALLPAGAHAQAHPVLRGTVQDAATGAPLAGVHVQGAHHEAFSDAAGTFAVMVDGDEEVLHFRRLGYAPQQVAVDGFTGIVQLAVQPSLLDRITVQGEAAGGIAVGTALAVAHADRSAIESRAATSVADALDGMEGVSVVGTGAWGSRAMLRGLTGERVAVMIDGNRVNRACTFGMDQGLATVDPATVERVEILTGPGSTLYGSGNLGGVINVVTRRAADARPFSGELRAGASSAVPGGTLGGTVRVQRARWDASASLDAANYDDYRTALGTVDGSGFRQASGDMKLAWQPAAAHRFVAQGQGYAGRDIGWPGMPGSDMSIPEEDRYALALDYGWQRGGALVDALAARAYRQRLDHHMVMRMQSTGEQAMTSLTDAASFSTTSGARLQARLVPGASVHVDLGMEATRWAAEATRWTETTMGMGEPNRVTLHTWPDVRIDDIGAFAQGELPATDAITLSAGARVDHVRRHSDEADATTEWIGTGNVGARAALGGGLSARTTLGIGYRIPDPTELFGLAIRPDGFLYRGNPELGTETSRNAELSLAYDAASAGISATVFRNTLYDLITPVLVPDETVGGRAVRTYDNLARARIEGVSGSAYWSPLDALALRGTATYTRGTDRATDQPLAQMPPLQGLIAARITPRRVVDWLELEGQGTARQERTAAALGERETAASAIMNVRAGVSLLGSSITAGVENVLDRYYRSHLDNPGVYQPGRNAFVRVTRAF